MEEDNYDSFDTTAGFYDSVEESVFNPLKAEVSEIKSTGMFANLDFKELIKSANKAMETASLTEKEDHRNFKEEELSLKRLNDWSRGFVKESIVKDMMGIYGDSQTTSNQNTSFTQEKKESGILDRLGSPIFSGLTDDMFYYFEIPKSLRSFMKKPISCGLSLFGWSCCSCSQRFDYN